MMIVPIVLLIVSLAGLLVKQGIEFRFNLLIAIGILLIFNLIWMKCVRALRAQLSLCQNSNPMKRLPTTLVECAVLSRNR